TVVDIATGVGSAVEAEHRRVRSEPPDSLLDDCPVVNRELGDGRSTGSFYGGDVDSLIGLPGARRQDQGERAEREDPARLRDPISAHAREQLPDRRRADHAVRLQPVSALKALDLTLGAPVERAGGIYAIAQLGQIALELL